MRFTAAYSNTFWDVFYLQLLINFPHSKLNSKNKLTINSYSRLNAYVSESSIFLAELFQFTVYCVYFLLQLLKLIHIIFELFQ